MYSEKFAFPVLRPRVHVLESTSKQEKSDNGETLAMKSLLQDDNSDSDDVLFESVAKPRRFQHGD